jgi:hypothetical protein
MNNVNKLIGLGVVAFAVTLAVLIADRLSNQALALIIGVFFGLLMSMPLCGLIIWLVLRQNRLYPNDGFTRVAAPPRQEQPQIIVVQPQQPSAAYPAGVLHGYAQLTPNTTPVMRPAREFKIVGQEEVEDESRDAMV